MRGNHERTRSHRAYPQCTRQLEFVVLWKYLDSHEQYLCHDAALYPRSPRMSSNPTPTSSVYEPTETYLTICAYINAQVKATIHTKGTDCLLQAKSLQGGLIHFTYSCKYSNHE